tara:strand:- start:398 stop:1108 length:711 start_codon:yes stop_codon:yes gene_type:complete
MQDQLLERILSPNIVPIEPASIFQSSLSLLFAAVFGCLIANSYKYSSQSISGGRQIKSSLLPLTLTVCVIITVVKSSLALSLGLVGALSIVRFRTPIKDPEDLVYLFLSIVSGLGFGANQNLFTSLGVSAILIVLTLRSTKIKRFKKNSISSLNEFNLNLEWDKKNNEISISKIIDVLSKNCDHIALIRFDQSTTNRNLVLQIGLMRGFDIQQVLDILYDFNDKISIQISNSAIDY